MIKIYRVANGDDLTTEEEEKNAYESFSPKFIHLRHDNGDYKVIAIYPEIHEDYTPMEPDDHDPEYDNIMEWVSEEGFVENMFDDEITGSVH